MRIRITGTHAGREGIVAEYNGLALTGDPFAVLDVEDAVRLVREVSEVGIGSGKATLDPANPLLVMITLVSVFQDVSDFSTDGVDLHALGIGDADPPPGTVY